MQQSTMAYWYKCLDCHMHKNDDKASKKKGIQFTSQYKSRVCNNRCHHTVFKEDAMEEDAKQSDTARQFTEPKVSNILQGETV